MIIGYARSPRASRLKQQEAMLKEAKCDSIHSEVASDYERRPVLRRLLKTMGLGDVLVVCHSDILTPNKGSFYNLIERLLECGIFFQSLSENLHTFTDVEISGLEMAKNMYRYRQYLTVKNGYKPCHRVIMNYISEYGSISTKEYAQITDRAPSTRSRDMRFLVENEVLDRVGHGLYRRSDDWKP